MGKIGGFVDAFKFGSKSADDVSSVSKIGKTDPLDPFKTEIKYKGSEPSLANLQKWEPEIPVVKGTTPTITTKPISSSVDDIGKIAVKTQANETANTILKQANKNSSVLGSLGKVAAATGIGVLVGGALAGTVAGQSTVLNPGNTGGGSDGKPSTVTTATDENGNTYYVYDTGNEGVDEALGWLQQQIDEIIEFLNGLLGGGGSGGSGGAFVTGGDDSSGSAANGKKMKLIAVIALVIIVAAAYFLTRRKKGGAKKGGSKK